jgi:Kef-type K+ transport system membrane component KefB
MLDQSNVKLIYPFALLMILAWLADLIGLATIVGAFAAGLIIEEEHFQMEKSSPQSRETVESIMAPLEGIFAPVFFVLMGIQVDVGTFLEMQVLLAGLALTAVAIISKVAASVIVKKGNDKFIVGFGMIPRGEVGLIFASIGKSLGVLDSNMFSVIIIVVLLTTLVTPPLLQWAIERKEKESLSG